MADPREIIETRIQQLERARAIAQDKARVWRFKVEEIVGGIREARYLLAQMRQLQEDEPTEDPDPPRPEP